MVSTTATENSLFFVELYLEVELARGHDDMLTRLLYKCLHARVGLIEQSQTLHKLRHLRCVPRMRVSQQWKTETHVYSWTVRGLPFSLLKSNHVVMLLFSSCYYLVMI